MDVSCPQCTTEYEFEDARIPDDGLTVKCTKCGHVFRMKKGQPVLPRPTEDSQPGREWRLRQASGTVFDFKRLTTLQKWIVERKVTKQDEISLTGDNWKRLGDIAELNSFFQLVDDAVRLEQAAARASAPAPAPQPSAPHLLPPPPPLPSYPPPPPAPSYPPPQPAAPPPRRADTLPPEAIIKPALTDTLPGPGFALDAPAAQPVGQTPAALKETIREPDFTLPSQRRPQPPPERVEPPPPQSRPPPPRHHSQAHQPQLRYRQPDDDEPVKLKGQGGALKWIILLLILAGGGGGGGYYYLNVWVPEQQAKAEHDRLEAERLKAEADAAALVAKKLADEEKAKAAALAAALDAGPPPVIDAGVAVVDAGVKLPPRPKSFEQLLAEGERLRERDKPEAALDVFGLAEEMKPDRVEPLSGKGFALLDMDNAAESESAFKAALRLNGRYGPALIGLAEASKTQGKKAQAIEYYQKYIDVLPNGSEAPMAANAIERLKAP